MSRLPETARLRRGAEHLFAKVPHELIEDPEASVYAIAVYAALISLCPFYAESIVDATVAEIMRRSHIKDRRVFARQRNWLMEAGWIEVEARPGYPNVYVIGGDVRPRGPRASDAPTQGPYASHADNPMRPTQVIAKGTVLSLEKEELEPTGSTLTTPSPTAQLGTGESELLDPVVPEESNPGIAQRSRKLPKRSQDQADPHWRDLVGALKRAEGGNGTATESEMGRIVKAAKLIRDACGGSEAALILVPKAIARYAVVMPPRTMVTATALAANWSKLTPTRSDSSAEDRERVWRQYENFGRWRLTPDDQWCGENPAVHGYPPP